jgi:hypothetical protein
MAMILYAGGSVCGVGGTINHTHIRIHLILYKRYNKMRMVIPNAPTWVGNKEIVEWLSYDMITRKLKHFPVQDYEETVEHPVIVDERVLVADICSIYWSRPIPQPLPPIDALLECFPLLKLILSERIIAAGGAVAKAIWQRHLTCDVDLFFIDDISKGFSYDPFEHLCEVIKQIDTAWLIHPTHRSHIVRNENAVSYYAGAIIDSGYTKYTQYQFVLRVYPSVGHVLGGFDIQAAAVALVCVGGNCSINPAPAYKIVTTKFGQWSCQNRIIIADTTRRSKSYEQRLFKYSRYCKIVFPGLRADKIIEARKLQRDAYYAELDVLLKEQYLKRRPETDTPVLDRDRIYAVAKDAVREATRDIGTTLGMVLTVKIKLGAMPPCQKVTREGKVRNIYPNALKIAHAKKQITAIRAKYPGVSSDKIKLKFSRFLLYYNRNCNWRYSVVCYGNDYSWESSTNFIDENLQYLMSGYGCLFLTGGLEVLEAPTIYNIVTPEYLRAHYSCVIDRALNDRGGKYKPQKSLNKNLIFAADEELNQPAVMEQKIAAAIQEVLSRAATALVRLAPVQFITRNPGRQWTSSVNPIIANPRDWYGEYYTPVLLGNAAVERELWRARVVYPFNTLPKEIFTKILLLVLFDVLL